MGVYSTGGGAAAASCPLFEPTKGTETMIRPLFDRVVIERTEEATQTASGLFLPETAKEKPAEGVVVAVGNGRVNDKGRPRRSPSRSATRSCSASTPAQRSRSRAKSA